MFLSCSSSEGLLGLIAREPSAKVKGQQQQKQRQETEFGAFLQEMTASHPASAIKQPSQAKAAQKEVVRKSQSMKTVQKAAKESSAVSGGGKDGGDRFSAAVDALAMLDISSPPGARQMESNGVGKSAKQESVSGQTKAKDAMARSKVKGGTEKAAQPHVKSVLSREEVAESDTTPAKDSVGMDEKGSRELSPSVAAVFEAASNKGLKKVPAPSQQGVKPEQKPDAESSSAALKNLLHIGSPPSHPAPHPLNIAPPRPPGPQANLPPQQPMSAAVLKLMRPSMLTLPGHAPRPGLLPGPYGPTLPMRGGRCNVNPSVTDFFIQLFFCSCSDGAVVWSYTPSLWPPYLGPPSHIALWSSTTGPQ